MKKLTVLISALIFFSFALTAQMNVSVSVTDDIYEFPFSDKSSIREIQEGMVEGIEIPRSTGDELHKVFNIKERSKNRKVVRSEQKHPRRKISKLWIFSK